MRGGFQMALTALLAGAPAILSSLTPVAQAAEYFEGQGTVYTLSDPNNGNCNFMAYPSDAVTKYAALNTKQWDATKNCGRCAEVMCTDAHCSGKTKSSEVVHIVDQCPGCASGDLDLAPDVFTAITGMKSDRLKIKWKFVDCPVTSKIKYCLKKGSNPFWAAVQPTNFASGIASVTVNGQETTMVDSAYYFLLDGKSKKEADLSKVTIVLVSVGGEKVEDTVSFAAADCVEGKSQFTPTEGTGGQDQQQQQTPVSSVTSAPSPAPVQQSQPVATPALSSAVVTVPVPAPAVASATTQERNSSSVAVSQVLAAISSSSSTVEVSDEADRAAVDDSIDQQESGLVATTSSPTSPPSSAPASGFTKSSPSNPPSSPSTSNTNGDNTSRANTENSDSVHMTSPAVIVLSVFGCVAAVVLIVMAVYVNKKKLDDKRADRREAGSNSGSLGELAVISINTTSDANGSFCQVTTPGGRDSSGALQFAVL